MKQKFLRLCITALMMLITTATYAYEACIDGIYYNFYIDGERATVTNKYDNTSNQYAYTGDVVIPETVEYNGKTYSVTSVGWSAFKYCSSLTSITIPNSVTSIDQDAFNGCKSLISITIGNSVTSIAHYAFTDCSSLTAVNITDLEAWCKINFLSYDSNPLYFAHHLYLNGEEVKDLVIPASVSNIGFIAFYGCSSLTSVTIPSSVTTIGEWAFGQCTSLTSITIPNSVTSIKGRAFYGCSSLTSISIPNSITSIGNGAFGGCSSLTSITIPNSVTAIGGEAFSGCSSLISTILPNSLASIGNRTFYNCKDLTSITIPESVASIGERAFYGCRSLTSINIPNSVTTIGKYAFSFCSALASINIGNSIASIGDNAFYSCSSLTSITIPNSVTSIGEYAFSGCSSLNSVAIPNSVTSIGQYAFSGTSLTEINIPNSLTEIANYMFSYCQSLSSITIPASVTSIGDYAFLNCTNLRDIYSYNPIPPTCRDDSFYYNIPSTAKLHVPQGARNNYLSANFWKKFRTIIEDINPEEEDDDSIINTSSNRISVNDKNGDNRVSVGDITYSISATQQGESYTTDDIEVVTKHVLGKRNVIVVWLSSGKQDRYYFNNVPTIRYDGDNIQIEKADGSEKVYTSDNILRITYDYMPVQDTHEYVDLGLPSGTLWATCNVGANSPEEYGDYFAWGEVVTKGYYDRSTYKYNDKDYQTSLTKYNIESSKGVVDDKTELDIEDDAAYVNWGSAWRIPSREQQEELLDTNNCTWTWITQNEVNGHLVTSKHNGNSIFLPAAGLYDRGKLNYVGDEGDYWSRSLYTSAYSYSLIFKDQWTGCHDRSRCLGLPIRPVRQ